MLSTGPGSIWGSSFCSGTVRGGCILLYQHIPSTLRQQQSEELKECCREWEVRELMERLWKLEHKASGKRSVRREVRVRELPMGVEYAGSM